MGGFLQDTVNTLGNVGTFGLIPKLGDDAAATFNPETIQPNVPNAPDDVQNAIAHQGQSTYDGADKWATQYMAGANNAGGLLNTDQSANKALGGDFAQTSDANNEALAKRSAHVFDQNMGALKQKADFAGVQRELQATNQTASNQINMANLKNNVDTRVQAANLAADQARAAVLGSIIGGVGSVAGVMAANNKQPPGANPTGGGA